MNTDTKVITIQSEDESNLLDVMIAFMVPTDFNEKIVESHIANFKKEKHDNYWTELSQSLSDMFNLKEVPFECFYIKNM